MAIEETTFSGGLSDRFRAITSIYKECKNQALPFKIHFSTPTLSDYIEPNEYNWVIQPEDINYNTKNSYPCTLLTYRHNIKNPIQKFAQRIILKGYIRKNYQQIHLYSNMATADKEYGILFNELFKPTPLLQEQLEFHLNNVGGKKTYSAIVFRFRQLLGDFKEGGETLPTEEKEKYIQRCINRVIKFHNENPNEKLLITSDSSTFLDRIKTFPYVYIIPGSVVHIGFTHDADRLTYMKSFVDYYMLSFAKTIYLMRDKKMYHSGFAHRAALLNDAEYKEIFL